MKSKYFGVGLRTGFTSDWVIGSGFSLYAAAAAAWLYGDFHVNTNEKLTAPENAILSPFNFTSKDHFDAGRAITDIALGLRYGYEFEDFGAFNVQLAWEQYFFFNQNQFEDTNGASFVTGTDLTMQGLTLSFGVEF